MIVMFYYLKNTFLLLGILTVASSFASVQVDFKRCPKGNGLFPKPGSSCKAYYKCRRWIPIEEVLCPPDQHFNAIKGWCDWADLYPCLEKPKYKECPRANGRFLKPGTNCKIYYDCCNGKPKEKACPQDQLFDSWKEKCEWPELYTCDESLSTIETSPQTLSTIFRFSTQATSSNKDFYTPGKISRPTSMLTTSSWISDTSISTQFVRTDQHDLDSSSSPASHYSTSVTPNTPTTSLTTTPKEAIISSTTDNGSTFNTRSSEDPISSVSTITPEPLLLSSAQDYFTEKNKISDSTIDKGSRTLTTSETIKESRIPTGVWEVTTPEILNILCPEPNGHFPHPTSQHKFVGCVDNIPYVFDCPHDLVYRHELGRCDYQ